MTSADARDGSAFEVSDRDGSVEVRGFTRTEVIDALRFLSHVRVIQASQVSSSKESLVHALMAQGVSLVPPASLRQAQKLAALRDSLLSTPVYTHATLAQARREKESSTRTWLSRRRSEGNVFTVAYEGRTLIPAFQFTEIAEPRRELAEVLAPLLKSDMDGWTIWSWLTLPTGLLSGEVPAEVARAAPERAAIAARRFAVRPKA